MMDRNEYKRHKRLIKKIIIVKEMGDCCWRCKKKFSYDQYDFHHLDPTEKEDNLAALLQCSLEAIRKEVEKCVCVCRACHNKIHEEQSNRLDDTVQEKIAKIIDGGLDEYTNDAGKIKFKKIIKKMQV